MSKKKDLVHAHHILAHLKLDDHTYTHLSTRSPQGFFLSQFGLRFEEVTEDSFFELSLNGNILNHPPTDINITGHVIHGSIYKKRPDVQAIFHLHTPSIIAVSALSEGLLPLSQWALHFYEKINYHNYGALAVEAKLGEMISRDLADKNILMLRNHGVIICGKTLHEAVYFAYHLERACQTQCLALGMNKPLIMPDHATCTEACNQLLSFEEDRGARDWKAWLRALERA